MKINKKNIIIYVCLGLILAVFIILLFFKFNMAKNLKIGNNKSSQDMVNDILNIKSYETVIEVDVKSNKNQNKYLIKQRYNGDNDNCQEVLEPNNIKGVKITKSNGELKLENSKLNLVSIFENYEYLSENDLDLSTFIKDYKENSSSRCTEKQDEVLMETISNNNLDVKKVLYIDKQKGKITKLEIEDTNKKTAVYILYREVNVNS